MVVLQVIAAMLHLSERCNESINSKIILTDNWVGKESE